MHSGIVRISPARLAERNLGRKEGKDVRQSCAADVGSLVYRHGRMMIGYRGQERGGVTRNDNSICDGDRDVLDYILISNESFY